MHDRGRRRRQDAARDRGKRRPDRLAKFYVPTVGTIAYIFDTEGNVVGISEPDRT